MTITPRERELVLAEREECARAVEAYSQMGTWTASETRPAIASAIRSRPQPSAPTGQAGPVPLPTYGRISFEELGRDVNEANLGKRLDFDFGDYFLGHAPLPPLNFNSLNRIVSKYASRPAVVWDRDRIHSSIVCALHECEQIAEGADLDKMALHILEALEADGIPPRVSPTPPDGYRVVPVEPTEEMLAAGHREIDWCRNNQNTHTNDHPTQTRGGIGTTCKQDLIDAWGAMLAASPTREGT